MKKRNNKAVPPLNLKPFGKKHSQVLHWWNPDISPYSDYQIIIEDGSIRSGKTLATVYSFFIYTQTCFRNQYEPTFAICGQTFAAVKRNVVDAIFIPMLEAMGINYVYRTSDGIIQVGHCIYRIYGAPNEAAQNKIQGATLSGSIADEVALYPESFFSQLIGRHSALDDHGRVGKIYCTCNPLGPNNWFKKNYIDNADKDNYLYIHFLMEDNIALSKDYIERQKKQHKGLFYRRNVLGEWCLSEGICYSSFGDGNIVKELPKMKEIYVGADFGDNHPTTYVMIGKGVDNKYYVFKEYKKNKQLIDKYVDDLRIFINGYQIRPIVGDSAAPTFIRQVKSQHIPIKGINKSSITVANAIGMINSMFGNNELFVHENCKEIINELYSYSWDPKASEHGEDKVIKLNDDLMDAMRYALMEYVINKPQQIKAYNINLF